MRYLKATIITLLLFTLQGCVFNDPKYINLKSKPNNHYYSNELYTKLKSNAKYNIKVFDSDMYKYYPVTSEDNDIVLSFLESLSTSNYLNDMDIKEQPKYELSIDFGDAKYIFNIYDENNVTLYPWDGTYIEDQISMDSIYPYNNLYSFCKYIINKENSH